MVHKALNNLAPDYLRNMFQYRNYKYSFDSANRLALPKPRTDYMKKSFGYSNAVLWNDLQSSARKSTTLPNFKSKVKTLFLKSGSHTANL